MTSGFHKSAAPPYGPDWTLRQCIETAQLRNDDPEAGYTFIDAYGKAKTYSFKALAEEAHRRAQGLLAQGWRKGDRVGEVGDPALVRCPILTSARPPVGRRGTLE